MPQLIITMIHYIDGKPSKNIKLSKSKAHAIQAYRQKKAVAELQDIAARALIVTIVATVLAVVYLSH